MSVQPLDDQTFIAKFENLSLDPEHFSHQGHLRIAWLYLQEHDLDTAVQLVCSGIKAYAESLGENTKFNVTITDALVRLMAQRMEFMEKKEWRRFLQLNPDLVEDSLSVLFQYYSEDLLFSETARTSLVEPDIRAISAQYKNASVLA